MVKARKTTSSMDLGTYFVDENEISEAFGFVAIPAPLVNPACGYLSPLSKQAHLRAYRQDGDAFFVQQKMGYWRLRRMFFFQSRDLHLDTNKEGGEEQKEELEEEEHEQEDQ